MKYELTNAQKMAINHPTTFGAPDKKDLGNLMAGMHVKICANFKNDNDNWVEAERFWVKIERIIKDEIEGIIDNDLVFTDRHGLRCYDSIKFRPDNIYQILEEEI